MLYNSVHEVLTLGTDVSEGDTMDPKQQASPTEIMLKGEDWLFYQSLLEVMAGRTTISFHELVSSLGQGRPNLARRVMNLGLGSLDRGTNIVTLTTLPVHEWGRPIERTTSEEVDDSSDEGDGDDLADEAGGPAGNHVQQIRAAIAELPPEDQVYLDEVRTNVAWVQNAQYGSIKPAYYRAHKKRVDALMAMIGIEFDPTYQSYRLPGFLKPPGK